MTSAVRTLFEERAHDGALYVHPEWRARFPDLVQGITGRDADEAGLSLFGEEGVGATLGRWRALRTATGMPTAVHAHQVHGARVLVHTSVLPAGLVICDDADGHLTAQRGLLLAVSIADCVPISIVHPKAAAVAALHAGWRGVAGGILGHGVAAFAALGAADVAALHVHLGPAICGECYEVGPEVHAALDLPVPDRNVPVDLRAVLTAQAAALGVRPEHITQSAYCTRCSADAPFFSHRRGDRARQMTVIGFRTRE